jgi:hypothetical protein
MCDEKINKINDCLVSPEELDLSNEGVLRLPEKFGFDASFWKEPRPNIPSKIAINAIVEERNGD